MTHSGTENSKETETMRDMTKVFWLTVFVFVLIGLPVADAQQTEEQHQIDAEIQQTWLLFLAEIRANDAQGAAEYVVPRVRKQYLEAFQNSGDQLHKSADGWSKIKAVNLSIPFAEYAVFDGEGDDQRMFFITFAKSADGSWMIYSM